MTASDPHYPVRVAETPNPLPPAPDYGKGQQVRGGWTDEAARAAAIEKTAPLLEKYEGTTRDALLDQIVTEDAPLLDRLAHTDHAVVADPAEAIRAAIAYGCGRTARRALVIHPGRREDAKRDTLDTIRRIEDAGNRGFARARMSPNVTEVRLYTGSTVHVVTGGAAYSDWIRGRSFDRVWTKPLSDQEQRHLLPAIAHHLAARRDPWLALRIIA